MKLDIQLFASGTIFESSDGKLRAKLTWSSSINEDGLGSTITATLSVRRTSGSGTTGTFSYNINIDGETWSGSKKLTSLGTSYKEVASKTKSINYSGSYSAYLYAKVNGPTDTSLEGLSVSGDGYAPLDATSYPATLNGVNIDNFVSQGKFTPYFTINQSGLYYGMYIIAYTPSQTIVSWNSPIAVSNGVEATLSDVQKQTLWNYLDLRENRTAVDIMFVLASYSDSSLSGDYQIGTSDIHFQNTIAIPSYSLQWDSATLGDTGMGTYYGGHPLYYYVNDMNSTFIKTLSTPYLRFSASSTTGYLYGKTITYTINGIARTSPYEDSSWDGTGSYTITASDGRVDSITTTLSKNVLDYFVPYLSNIRVVRPIPTDDVVRVSYKVNYYNGDGLGHLSPAQYNFWYREDTNDAWVKVDALSGHSTSGSQTFSNVDIDNLNYKKPFYYKIEFTDRIGNTTSVFPYSSSIPKGLPVWNAYVDSNDDNVLNINGNMHTDGAINQTNPSTRVGSNIVLRGTTTYPEASINVANPDGSHSYIVGYGVGGGDNFAMYSTETIRVILTIDREGRLTASGEVRGGLNNGYGQFRAAEGNYGFLIRNDGGYTYFMLTNSGDAYGSWNSLRPITINNANGGVIFNEPTTFNSENGNIAKWGSFDENSGLTLDQLGDNYAAGFYCINTNGPEGNGWYYVMQNTLNRSDTNWRYQEVVLIWTYPMKKFVRCKIANVWQAWQQVW